MLSAFHSNVFNSVIAINFSFAFPHQTPNLVYFISVFAISFEQIFLDFEKKKKKKRAG